MEVEEEERTQHETTASYHSLRTSLSLEDLRTALQYHHHHGSHVTSPCTTAVSLTRIVSGPAGSSDRWQQFLDDTTVDQVTALGCEMDTNENRLAAECALNAIIARVCEENNRAPSPLSTARRHSFRLSDGDTCVLEVPTAALDQYDDPWAPPNSPVDETLVTVECTTTCSTMESISPSASRERIAGEVAEYLLIKGGAWHGNVNDSIRVEVTTPPASKMTPSKSSSASPTRSSREETRDSKESTARSRSRSARRVESATCRWEETAAEIRDCGR